jgi:hypothetical protein
MPGFVGAHRRDAHALSSARSARAQQLRVAHEQWHSLFVSNAFHISNTQGASATIVSPAAVRRCSAASIRSITGT